MVPKAKALVKGQPPTPFTEGEAVRASKGSVLSGLYVVELHLWSKDFESGMEISYMDLFNVVVGESGEHLENFVKLKHEIRNFQKIHFSWNFLVTQDIRFS